MNYIRWFDIKKMVPLEDVGGKNAALILMTQNLAKKGIPIPLGFALTADAYWHVVKENDLLPRMKKIMSELKNYQNLKELDKAGTAMRSLFTHAVFPKDLAQQIVEAYHDLSKKYKTKNCDVAVRSSATAEDLPTASFAGQQETFLNVKGEQALLTACKKSMASLFTDRAIVYRKEHGFDHFKVALSVGIQKMVRADKASSGVAFSLDTESGFKNVIMIDSAWGLGESIVKGLVTPDEFYVFKPTLGVAKDPILKRQLGDKKTKIIYTSSIAHPTKKVAVPKKDQERLSLSDDEVVSLATMVQTIEDFYSKKNKRWTPMDIEWAKDGDSGKIYIVQARPETVQSQKVDTHAYTVYSLREKNPTIIITGISIGQGIVSGPARVIKNIKDIKQIKKGDIIVTTMTDPDWVTVMKQSAGIITDLGGRTCHAAIVSRELGLPALIGTNDATKKIKNGQTITIDCSQGATGFVYQGAVPFEMQQIDVTRSPRFKTKILVNCADPDAAFKTGMLPVDGVGLARMEFIISHAIKIHPMALVNYGKITHTSVKKKIEKLTEGYKDKKQFFIDRLAQGIGMIAAGFYPRPVIVRLSDFKTNEYRDLIGGEFFEQEEANPMLGFRGASRYTHELYKDAFALECQALKKVRETMGLDNAMIMVPFVRTVSEAKKVIELLKHNGLKQDVRGSLHKNSSLELIMMCEVPSNVILMDQFAQLFDGFSIGSNDLTQLILGIDRDSSLLSAEFDERDLAVERMIAQAIQTAHTYKRPIGICGQAPSDYPEFAQFLIERKIDSISLNPDAVLPFLLAHTKKAQR